MADQATAAMTDRRDWLAALGDGHVALLLFLIAAIATRVVAWRDPVMHGDDQLYLLVGSRMWHGEWPYLDLWDRKPVGLFALYALIARLGGDSMVVVKLVATAFVIASAWVVRRIALRFASPRAATLAGLSYIVILPLFGGQTGQSPVFYNLFMAGAALLLFEAAEGGRVQRRALLAMLLCGVSLTIKPVSLFEGVYFGLAFLWLMRRAGSRAMALAGNAVAMIAVALLPTLLTFLPYAARGPAAVDAFAYANVGSVFGRSSWGWGSNLAGATLLVMFGLVLAGYAVVGLRDLEASDRRHLLAGWLLAAALGYLAVPNFFEHYALPLMAPLSVAAARFYDRPSGALFFAAFAVFCLVQRPMWNWRTHEVSRQTYERIASEVDRARRGGCLYVAKGPSLLYLTTGACHVTRFVFPPHLIWIIEQGAIGTDNLVELERTLGARPAVVVTRAGDRHDTAPPADALLRDALARDYRETYRTTPPPSRDAWPVVVYQRRDLPPPG